MGRMYQHNNEGEHCRLYILENIWKWYDDQTNLFNQLISPFGHHILENI